jgi:nitroreductase
VELREAITSRRMVRRCADAPVADDVVDDLLDLALRAPSAGWSQGQSFVVVRDERQRAAIAEAAGEPAYVARGFDPWLSSAPVLVVPCADERAYRRRYDADDKQGGPERWDVPYWWLDLGAAVQNLLLLATEAGLAAGFLGAHAVDRLPALLSLPTGVQPAGIVTLGHPPADEPPPTTSEQRGRRPLHDVVHRERWHEPGDPATP